MTDRAKVIKGLECCATGNSVKSCKACPYYNTKYEGDQICMDGLLIRDAYALLKEQAPRVLTLDEAIDGTQVYYVEFRYHLDRGWVKCDFDRMYVDGEVAMLFLRDKTFYQQKEHYGQLWRLWNRRPTDEQMKAVKWNA